MKRINPKPIPANVYEQEFVDYTGKMLNLEKLYYYQVKAEETCNGATLQTFDSTVFSWNTDLDLVGLYVVEEHLFQYEFVDGVPIAILKKLKEGERCSNCFDTVLKRVTKSNCTVCFGTGFTGGYYPPIKGWIKFEPDPTIVQIAEWGKRQIHQTDGEFTNYPELSIGDIFVELKKNKYYRISNVRRTEKNRTTMLQIVRVDEINRSDIEYQLQIDDDFRAPLIAELEARSKIPEF
jgi:hypothetical protein